MKVGIDFGTTYTKISYLDEHGNPKLFLYPGPPNGRQFVPTAVAYTHRGGKIAIGEAARLAVLNEADILYYEAFKMLLPLKKPSDWKEHGWPDSKTPTEVTRDYFLQLLRESEYSFEKQNDKIDGLVVSVPELWQKTADNPGAEALKKILAEDLNLPLDHLRSEPVCAAAFYVYSYQKLERRSKRPFNLLICDVGGGTFDVALCRVEGSSIKVLTFDGNGQYGVGEAGVSFDRAAVQIACSQANGGQPVSFDNAEFIELVREFEHVKIEKHDEVSKHIVEFKDIPEVQDASLYSWHRGKYKLNIAQVLQAFEPVKKGIEKVLTAIQQHAAANNWSIDRVAIVGGFGQFPLVEQTILDCLGIKGETDVRFDRTLNSENRFYAIAMGAALIANGIVDPVEYYPHTLGIIAHRIRNGELTEEFIPIVKPGEMPAGNLNSYFAQEDGKPLVLDIQRSVFGRLPVYMQLHGSSSLLSLSVPEVDYPPPGKYRVGLAVDRSNLGKLVFESIADNQKFQYLLGNVNPQLVAEDG